MDINKYKLEIVRKGKVVLFFEVRRRASIYTTDTNGYLSFGNIFIVKLLGLDLVNFLVFLDDRECFKHKKYLD